MKIPLFKIQVSNQLYSTAPVTQIKEDSNVKETFNFWINSLYKGNGRFI